MRKVSKKGIMVGDQANNSPKLHRNEVEKIRRMYMKDLYCKLAFLIPTPSSKSSTSMLLEHAATHIKNLQERLDMLKQKKLELLQSRSSHHHISTTTAGSSSSRSPVMLVRELGSTTLEVFLMSGLNKNFFLHEVIGVLEEEAARVVRVNQSTVGDRIIYRIYSEAVSSRIGIETSRVHERLEELIIS